MTNTLKFWIERIIWTILLWSATLVATAIIAWVLRAYAQLFKVVWLATEQHFNWAPLW